MEVMMVEPGDAAEISGQPGEVRREWFVRCTDGFRNAAIVLVTADKGAVHVSLDTGADVIGLNGQEVVDLTAALTAAGTRAQGDGIRHTG
jgi:hypothetical protein